MRLLWACVFLHLLLSGVMTNPFIFREVGLCAAETHMGIFKSFGSFG
jgi:hypothetical protein